MKRFAILLAAVLALTAGACNGGDDGGDVTAASSTTTTAEETTTSEAEDGEETTTTSAADETTSTTGDDTTDTSFTGDADSEFCRIYQALDDLPDPFGGETVDPTEAADVFNQAALLADQAVDAAPDEITEEMRTLADGVRRFDEILAKYDYDIARFSNEGTEEEFAALNDPALTEASSVVEAYASDVCGIETGG